MVSVAVDAVAAVHGGGAASCHGGRHGLARPLVCLVSCSFFFFLKQDELRIYFILFFLKISLLASLTDGWQITQRTD